MNAEDVRSMPCSVNPGQEPPVERTSDAVRSGAGGRRVSALIWKKRVSKKRRAKIVELIQRTCPTAKDTVEAMELTLEDGSFRDVWLFMLVKEFSGIMAGGAEPVADVIERESESGAGSQNKKPSCDGGEARP